MKTFSKTIISSILAATMSYTVAPMAAAGQASVNDGSTNVLIAYFSCTNNTESIATHISKLTGGDMYEIVPVEPYTDADLNYNTDCRANREQNDPAARPEILGNIENIEQYDAVFLGYPIWWGQAPKIIYTFLESYDFSGKTIIPFCTSGSSGIGTSATNLHSLVSDSVQWEEGRRFSGSASESTVKSWTDTITLPEKDPGLTPSPAPMPEVTVDETTVTVTNAGENAHVIMVFYMDGVLTDVRIKKGPFSEKIPQVYANEMKVFVRDTDMITPLCDAKAIRITPSAPKPVNDGFVKISGGTFTMGSNENEPEREKDEIVHEVTLGDFYISPTEVTQAQYNAVMGENPSERKGDNLPVTNVSWYDAIAYCNALSKSQGFDEAYSVNGNTVTWDQSASGYRLPTEAEWEYAARANTTTPFTFGDYVQDSDANCYNAYGYNNDASGNWINGYIGNTVDVADYNANGNGLYNVHGNAAEWVWDWYSAYDLNETENPTGMASGSYKVLRGGMWNDMPKHIRSAYRSANAPDVGTYGTGIRIVRGAAGSGIVTSTFNTVEQKTDKKVLIAFFSQTGNTEGLTKIIAEMTGADVFRIERKTPYSAQSNSQILYGEALNELREFAVPDLKTSLEDIGYNIADYDTILLGYSNWWGSIPAPVRSFLTKYDMSQKTIVPYCSMGGGRFAQTISAIAKLTPNSNIKEGLDVTYASYDRERIKNWLQNSGITVK